MTNKIDRTTAPRPRIIERWFPCAEVSAASSSGWGSSNSETLLMSWFAKRPLAQSRAAVLCSLLPWPEDEVEQERVKAIIRESLGVCQDPDWYACRKDDCDDPDCTRRSHCTERDSRDPHAHGIVDCARQDPNEGYDAARTDVLRLLRDAYPDRPAEMLDPFSGRGLIPVEAARFQQQAHAIDYSPVATLASRLLIDWPFRDWSQEPELPFTPPPGQDTILDPNSPQRLIRDIEIVQYEVQRRIDRELDEYYPDNENGEKPWAYLWASVIPCDGCGREFPLFGSNTLRKPSEKHKDPGASFELRTNQGDWKVEIVEGVTDDPPTMRVRPGKRGKLAWCPFPDCGHAHELPEHKRLVRSNYHRVEMLVVSDLDGNDKLFREPTACDRRAAKRAGDRLAEATVNGLPARPDEEFLPASGVLVRGQVYGARTFGDLSVARQNLLHATIAQSIAAIADEMRQAGCSHEYASALAGYCAAVLTRKTKYATRGARLQVKDSSQMVGDIFVNESSIAFNYDFLEVGLGAGPGSWSSVTDTTPTALKVLLDTDGRPATVGRGSALHIPGRDASFDAVVTDPPYQFMIAYSDVSDLFYVWLRRALAGVNPDFAMTAHSRGLQEKSEEIIVKQGFEGDPNEHRTTQFYNSKISEAFAECRRVINDEGVVSIVFGHGDPDAWHALLDAITGAGLVLTGAWPANTEKGGQPGSSNISTTLTLACRPAPIDRPDGRVAEVDAEMRREVAKRVRDVWEPSGLSYVDQKMAAAGPALEVVGRYERVLDKKGRPVDLDRYLPLARQAVTDAHDLRFDSLPLETFDQKTRFALEWVKAYGRRVQAASEARWQRLAADLKEQDTEGVLKDISNGVRLIKSAEADVEPVAGMPLFKVALAAANAWRTSSLADAASAVRAAGVDPRDGHFWACINALSKNLPETDPDGRVWTSMVRNRDALEAGIASAEAAVQAERLAEDRAAEHELRNPTLFDDPNSLFGPEGH